MPETYLSFMKFDAYLTTMITVLVALRSCLLLRFYWLQDFHQCFPDANYRQTITHLDSLHGYGPNRHCWTRLLLPHAFAMQASLVFLDQNRHGSRD